jgi:hypothetical protein
MRIILAMAGVYHILFALWVNVLPGHAFDLLGLPHPNHPALWRTLGVISGILGLGLLISAKDPIHHWAIILLALIKTSAVSFIIGAAVFNSELSTAALGILLINDLVWLPFFVLILWASIRAHAGIPPSRRNPYSINEAAQAYQLSDGRTLNEASSEKPLALVFLRHFGCTFTRQILRGLQDLEKQAKENDSTLVIVHMLQSGDEIEYLGQNSDITRIADPRCELYRSFGLGKGGFLELFGPQIWLRGFVSVIKGCGVGHLAGDGLQMPGAFLFYQGEIVASQPAQTAADLPDLASLFKQASKPQRTVKPGTSSIPDPQ